MSCTRELSITITEEEAEDMPLHSAVYDPTRGKIFAVRGGRVFKFNKDTLDKEDEVVYNAGPTLSDSYICYDSGRDCLWATYSPTFGEPPAFTSSGVPSGRQDKHIYKLSADNLSTLQTVGVETDQLGSHPFPGYNPHHVIRTLTSAGQYLVFTLHYLGVDIDLEWIVFDPDNLPFYVWNRNVSGSRWTSLEYLGGLNIRLSADGEYNNPVIERSLAAPGTFVENSGGYPIIGDSTNTKATYGFTYHAGNNKVYAANRSNLILKLDWGAPYGGTAIDLGAVVDVWNIRPNPNNGLLYAADIGGNQIAVIDPSDDSFELKAGFDAPWDVIFTDSKAVAIQHSAEGLKEIT